MSLRVLLIEYEPTVTAFIKRALQKHEIEVVSTGNCVHPESPHDCQLECCAMANIKPDVVIAAVIAPRDCSGIEAAAKAIRLWSDVKVLFISTSPADMWPEPTRDIVSFREACVTPV